MHFSLKIKTTIMKKFHFPTAVAVALLFLKRQLFSLMPDIISGVACVMNTR
jgi:hypothetical protein